MYTTAAILSRIYCKSVKRFKRELEELHYKHRLIIYDHHDYKRGRRNLTGCENGPRGERELSAPLLMEEPVGVLDEVSVTLSHLLYSCESV